MLALYTQLLSALIRNTIAKQQQRNTSHSGTDHSYASVTPPPPAFLVSSFQVLQISGKGNEMKFYSHMS